jgi:hypothetical protein
VTLFIVDKHIVSGCICSQCNGPAIIKKLFRLGEFEWELYACRTCRSDNEFYDWNQAYCARCSMPDKDILCATCKQELQGQNRFLSDTRQYLSAATAMFRYGAIRYSGGTA